MPTTRKAEIVALLAAAAMALTSPIVDQAGAVSAQATTPAGPIAAQAPSAELPIDTAAAFALTRPRTYSAWEPLAWPMRHIELDGLARRLRLTHEQTIALERLHHSYFEAACAQRLAAIDAYFKINPDVMRVPNVQASPDEVRKAVGIRRNWLNTLSQLEAAFFGEASNVLAENQAAQLPREQARRERARYATDAWVSQWFSRGWSPRGYELPARPPFHEVADIVEGMSLAADQRAAIEGALAEYESKLARQVKVVFEAACKAREHWSAITSRLFSPEYNDELGRGLLMPCSESMRLVMIEHAAIDRLAGMLPAETGEALRRRYLRTVAPEYIESSRFSDQMYEAALARSDLTADERAQIAAARAQANDAAFAAFALEIQRNRLQSMQMTTIGGRPQAIQQRLLPPDIVAIVSDRGGNPLGELGSKSFDVLKPILGDERVSEINGVVIQANTDERRRRIDAPYAPDSNFQTQGVNFSPYWAMPRPAAAADVQIVLERLPIDEGSAAVIRALNDDRAAAWQSTLKHAERDILSLRTVENQNETAPVAATYARYRAVLADLAASEAAFGESLRAALEGLADEAMTLLTLGRAWSLIVSTPPSCPPPVDLNSGSQRASITQHWDRVHAVRVLLGLDVPLERIEPGIAILAERSAAVQAAGESCRDAVLGAIEAGEILSTEMMATHDWTKSKPARQRQSDAANEGLRQRAAFIGTLRETHEAVAAALDAETAEMYRRAVQRIAYPSAVQGIDGARAIINAALRVPDLDDAQRERLKSADSDLYQQLLQAADDIAALLDQYVQADGYTPDAEASTAAIYAKIEHALFVKDELCAAATARVRSLLTGPQMQLLQTQSRSQ